MALVEKLGKILYITFGRVALPLVIGGSRRTRVVLFNKANNKVLLVRSLISDQKWHLPGGGMHTNEKAVHGALRELREEVGIELEPKQLRFICEQQESDKGARFTVFYYQARALNPVIAKRRFEIIEAGWFRPNDLPKNTAQNVPDVLAAAVEQNK